MRDWFYFLAFLFLLTIANGVLGNMYREQKVDYKYQVYPDWFFGGSYVTDSVIYLDNGTIKFLDKLEKDTVVMKGWNSVEFKNHIAEK